MCWAKISCLGTNVEDTRETEHSPLFSDRSLAVFDVYGGDDNLKIYLVYFKRFIYLNWALNCKKNSVDKMDIKGRYIVGLNNSVDININSMGQEYQFESVGKFGNVLAN